MARLNDPPVPTESIDALKRRFIRQNREIARVNSTQSLRIRNLEAEISRLLAENISLREQAINSAQEAERWRSSHKLITEVGRLKDRLESRLSEVGAIVTELGSLPEKAARRESCRRRSGILEPVRSPDEQNWKNGQAIAGVIAGERELQEGRLPPIHEDKCYPRKTLEGQEIECLLEGNAEASESPDLGPPPVAHFDVPEPIKFESRLLRGDTGSLSTDEEEAMVTSINLETRRKRRVSSLLQNTSSLPEEPVNAVTEAQERDISLKPGSKRKLSTREEDDGVNAVSKASDDFTFERKSATFTTPRLRTNNSRFTRPVGTQSTQPSNAQTQATPPRTDQSTRKVLAPKSTNSPTKVWRPNVNDKISVTKEDDEKSTTATATRHGRRQSSAPARHEGPTDDQLENQPNQTIGSRPEGAGPISHLPPKTPAGLDLISPTSTEPSVKSNAQPTEMAVTASVEDVLGNAGRGSRRAKAAVSYAEPNLRDKMRRPGKELVTAVEGIGHFKNRESSVRADSVDRHADENGVKKEPLTDDTAWKHMAQAKDEPPSPLSNKVSRLSGEPKERDDGAGRPAASPASLETAVSKLSIYDGPSSSPSDAAEASQPHPIEGDIRPSEVKKATLKTRRHFANSTGLSRQGQDVAALQKVTIERPPRPSSASGHRAEGGASRPGSAVRQGGAEGRRPSSVADLRRSTSIANDGSKASVAPADLKRPTSVAALGDGSGRTERAASRRRSMMI